MSPNLRASIIFSVFALFALIGAGPAPEKGAAVNLGPNINTPDDEFGPIVTADGNALYFTSERKSGSGGQDIWVSRRVDGEWQKAENLGDGVNTKYHEGPDSFSIDEKTMYFTRCIRDTGATGCDLHVATRGDKDGKWGDVKKLGDAINSPADDANASISHDGKTLYFVSNRPRPDKKNSSDWNIYRSTLENGKWAPAKLLGAPINTDGDELQVVIQKDGKSLYFCSNGHKGLGGADVFVSEILPGDKFGPPQNLGPVINSEREDIYFTIPASGELAYFASDRPGGFGMNDIYTAPIPVVMAQEVALAVIKGTVVEKVGCAKTKTGGAKELKACMPIKGAKIVATAKDGKSFEAVTDAAGLYSIVLAPGATCNVSASANGFKKATEVVEIGKGPLNREFVADFLLEASK